MIGRAIAAEFRKTFSTRMWWVLLVILVGYVAFLAAVIGLAATFDPEGLGGTGGGPLPFAIAPLVYSMVTSIGYLFPVIFGAVAVTGEVRHRTLTPTFLTTPSRGIVLAAKLVVGAIVGAVYGIAGLVAAVGLGGAILGAAGIDTLLDQSDTWAMLGRIVLAMAIWALVGVGLGVLVPSQIGSIVAIIAFTQLVEPIARMAGLLVEALDPLTRYLPGAAGDALVGQSIFAVFGGGAGDPLEWWQGGLVLLAYAIVFAVIGNFTFWRRDVT